jgi:4-alpha-glucanotransferase
MSLPQFPRAAGILLHPTSLPSSDGIGGFSRHARQFLRFCADAGVTWWQVLPLVPPGPGNSPYATSSSGAGNPALIDLDALIDDGLLARAAPPHVTDLDRIDDAAVLWKRSRIAEAATAFAADRVGSDAIEHAIDTDLALLDDALFDALHDVHRAPWWTWDHGLKWREAHALRDARTALSSRIRQRVAEQLLFQWQWSALRADAAAVGVRMMGDIPIYVDADSVDVWCNTRFFQLDHAGRSTHVAGVPPDVFSATGQLWGNPLYDWDALARDGFRFWVRRLQKLMTMVDVARIDHFRGFCGYWSVPFDDETAEYGSWMPARGAELFDVLRAHFGNELPFVAEDLGVITDDVTTLRLQHNLPGMKILQFAFGADSANAFLPHNCEENAIVYTGTHDNNTTQGFYQSAPEEVRDHMRRYLARDGHDVAWDLMRAACSTRSHTVIFPMQDVLSLDGDARMNLPGTASGNWGWRVREDAFHPDVSSRLRGLLELYGRSRTTP